ncbi:Lsr2 family protein [Nocardia sp. BMG111209]|uniref:histone-like nucleoid-structuring protein Lsr2 n=1 Tax=Nocardia sp. BMG111209 TaxID=1160137 RepID=UPI0004768CC2|nr:Lsr2 family protein [Nocardia sp. BMG111209]
MAQKTMVETFDDISGERIDPNLVPEPTITFSLDGTDYEIDLGARNRDEFFKQVEPYIQAARRVGRRGAPRAGTRTRTAGREGGGLSKEETAAIRMWAQKSGHTVSTRGRLSAALISAYRNGKH